jgi:hypothetical protein
MSARPLRRARGVALSLLVFVAVLSAGSSEAGMMRPADHPSVFPGADLNVVVLPYRTDPGVGRPLGEAARGLGLLLQLNSLLTLGRYGSLGVIYLHTPENERDVTEELVEDQLLGKKPGADAIVRPGKALVLLWGRIYQEGPDIYLQSSLRFLQRGEADGIERRLPQGGVLRARTPAQRIVFPPLRLSEEHLLAIQRDFAHASRIYDQPSTSAPSKALPVESDAPMAFSVDRVEGGWLQVSGERIGAGKWLKAELDLRVRSLRPKMPELDFLDAVAAYLQARVAHSGPPPPVLLRAVEESLGRYQEGSRGSGPGIAAVPAIPAAVGKVLLGNLQVLAGHPEAAEPLYHAAAGLLPYSADARNLEIVARAAHTPDADLAKPEGPLAEAWLDALTLEPANLDIVDNLAALYELQVRASHQAGAPPGAVGAKLAAVKRVQAALRENHPPEFGTPP